jgi:hypothetical protein
MLGADGQIKKRGAKAARFFDVPPDEGMRLPGEQGFARRSGSAFS